MDKTYFTREKPVIAAPDVNVFVNQAGYFPNQTKKAAINIPCKLFTLISESGEVCYQGETTYFGHDKNSDDEVYIADFTEFNQQGRYCVSTDDGRKSQYFSIGTNCYTKLFYDINRAYYYLRCGCGLDETHAGEFKHAPCHTENAVLWENPQSTLDVKGGWHDAGDYGRYVTAGACALAHLLNAFIMFPTVFEGRRFNLPDSKEEVPDILTECRYEIEWLLKMQRQDGGVYHKATTAKHAPFIMPEEDTAQMYVFAVSSMATADFSAVLAMASRVYRKYDEDFADKLLEASLKAYEWLENNPNFVGFENPEGCNTGGYGERDDIDNRFWAAAELFCTTEYEKYHTRMKNLLEKNFPHTALGYAQTGGFGALSYLLSESKCRDERLAEQFKAEFLDEAESLKKTADICGYGAAMKTEDYGWGSNMALMKHAMTFIIAEYFSTENTYKDYITAQLDYLMGVNCTGYSYVTGNGDFCCKNPHLRPAFADGVEECIPGMVSGGANRYPCDFDAEILVPKGTPPMKCYADDVGCYSLNEITIYWNSPTVFTAAYILSAFLK